MAPREKDPQSQTLQEGKLWAIAHQMSPALPAVHSPHPTAVQSDRFLLFSLELDFNFFFFFKLLFVFAIFSVVTKVGKFSLDLCAHFFNSSVTRARQPFCFIQASMCRLLFFSCRRSIGQFFYVEKTQSQKNRVKIFNCSVNACHRFKYFRCPLPPGQLVRVHNHNHVVAVFS